jgi:hypothetical protein
MEWTEATINSYISGRIEESLSLEYKAAGALGKHDKCVTEITKDVSAFANSAGGIIIYGLREFSDKAQEHLPEKIDPVDRREFSKEWLEQILNTIQPRPKVIVHPVQLSSTAYHAVYVIEVPQSSTAHQARDHRYYKRFNFECRAMEDYEIRDVMRRRTHPVVKTEIRIVVGKVGLKNEVIWRVVNESDVMARYVYSIVDVPIKIGAHYIRFEDQSMVADEGFSFWRLRPSNNLGRPLFPRSDMIYHFQFKFIKRMSSYASGEEPRFRDVVMYKTYADEMPFVQGQCPVEEITTRLEFD